MSYDFSSFEDTLSSTQDWLQKKLANIRTGEANPAMLDDISVDSYGTDVPLNQVGNIGREDRRTLFIDVWENENIEKVEKAIVEADLGVSVSSTQEGVRVNFPQLTEESREKFKKQAKEQLEEARIRVRKAREEVWNDIQDQEDAGEISEDAMYRHKEEMEEMVQDTNDALQELFEKKEEQLSA